VDLMLPCFLIYSNLIFENNMPDKKSESNNFENLLHLDYRGIFYNQLKRISCSLLLS
jgi:hypothetical protein